MRQVFVLSGLSTSLSLPDYARFARQSGAIAVTSFEPTSSTPIREFRGSSRR